MLLAVFCKVYYMENLLDEQVFFPMSHQRDLLFMPPFSLLLSILPLIHNTKKSPSFCRNIFFFFYLVTTVVSAVPATHSFLEYWAEGAGQSSVSTFIKQSRKPGVSLLPVEESLQFYQPLVLRKLQEHGVCETSPLSLVFHNLYVTIWVDGQYSCVLFQEMDKNSYRTLVFRLAWRLGLKLMY